MRWVVAGAVALSVATAGVVKLAELAVDAIEEGAARIP